MRRLGWNQSCRGLADLCSPEAVLSHGGWLLSGSHEDHAAITLGTVNSQRIPSPCFVTLPSTPLHPMPSASLQPGSGRPFAASDTGTRTTMVARLRVSLTNAMPVSAMSSIHVPRSRASCILRLYQGRVMNRFRCPHGCPSGLGLPARFHVTCVSMPSPPVN